MQQNHIAKPCFIEDSEVQQKMDISTDEVTQMFSHCQRLIGFVSFNHFSVLYYFFIYFKNSEL